MESKMFKEWLKERDEAVKSLDLATFKAFYKKWLDKGMYNIPLPSDEITELAIHKMALEITTIPQEIKDKALEWLKAHGSKPIDWSKDD